VELEWGKRSGGAFASTKYESELASGLSVKEKTGTRGW